MDLIVHQMVEFEHIHVAYGHGVVKGQTRPPVIQDIFAVAARAGSLQHPRQAQLVCIGILCTDLFLHPFGQSVGHKVQRGILRKADFTGQFGHVLVMMHLLPEEVDVALGRAVKYRGGDVPAVQFGDHAQVHFQYLADIQSGRHAQGVQYDFQRRAVREERHILLGEYAADDALVAVTPAHLVSDGDFPALGHIDADGLIDPGAQVVVILAGERLHVHDDAGFAVGHAQGCVAHLAHLLAEYGAQEPLLGVELGLAFGGHFAHENIPAADFGAHANDAALVQILNGILADIGNFPGNLLGAQLRVAGLALVLLDMDGGKDILADQPLVDQNGVFVIVTLPAHKADEDVAAQSDLAAVGGGAVR